MSDRKISVTGSNAFSELKVGQPADYAAGINGIKAALEHTSKEMGLFKSLQKLAKLNQKDGFDCPGCAWPDPDDRSKLGEYCENGAKALAEEATNQRVDRDFFEQYSVEELSQWTDYAIGKSGRITEPFVLKPGSLHYEPISWDDAFILVADHLRALNHPDEAIFYTSGRSSNEAAFLYGLFARAFGTNNMPDCSNMCHESSGVGLKETLGLGKGSVTLDDFPKAEVIMVIGQNPGTNHPRMLSALQKCKENGGKIISINPLKEAGLVRFKNPQQINGLLGHGVTLTDVFLQVKINQDVALLKLLMKRLKELDDERGEVFDWDFINEKTIRVENLLDDLAEIDEQKLLEKCGVDEAEIDKAVAILAEKKKIIICWAMGLTQHKNAVDNIKACVNLLLLKGSIGKPGSGTCPVRGHSNVQGDRTVGIVHYTTPQIIQSYRKVFGFDPPENPGYDTVDAIQAMHQGNAKVFMALGGNFVSAASDTYYTGEALQKCELTISVSTKLNRTHLVVGKTSLILPTLGRSEKDIINGEERYVTVENSMGKVHRSQGRFTPASDQLKSEPEIIAQIALAYFGDDTSIDWVAFGDNYQLIREKISEVFSGFEEYEFRSGTNGFYLPNNARVASFANLPQGKAPFSICAVSDLEPGKDEFVLMTIRSHDQFNTTIYGMDDRYRGIFGERRIVLMNREDMQEHGFAELETVNLQSGYAGSIRKAENFKIISYDIPKGNLAAYFPETNPLIPIDQTARGSNTPVSKSVIVKVLKLQT